MGFFSAEGFGASWCVRDEKTAVEETDGKRVTHRTGAFIPAQPFQPLLDATLGEYYVAYARN